MLAWISPEHSRADASMFARVCACSRHVRMAVPSGFVGRTSHGVRSAVWICGERVAWVGLCSSDLWGACRVGCVWRRCRATSCRVM